jgi:hypothetical protein
VPRQEKPELVRRVIAGRIDAGTYGEGGRVCNEGTTEMFAEMESGHKVRLEEVLNRYNAVVARGNRTGTMAPATRALFRAAGALLYGEGRAKIPRTAPEMAKLLVECAYEHQLAPDDTLNADQKNVRAAAHELLAGMRATER